MKEGGGESSPDHTSSQAMAELGRCLFLSHAYGWLDGFIYLFIEQVLFLLYRGLRGW